MASIIDGKIYRCLNKKNGKVYIGKTSSSLKDRIACHVRDSCRFDTLFYKAIRKHGIDSFTWLVIDTASSEDELNDMEKEYIDMFSSCIRHIGYNSTHGGDGVLLNNESRQKMSRTKTGKASPMKGRHFSEEAVKNMRASRIGIWDRNEHPMKGKVQSVESIEKMKATKLKNLVLYRKECSVCGKVFEAKVSFAKNCSKLCTLRASRARRKQEEPNGYRT